MTDDMMIWNVPSCPYIKYQINDSLDLGWCVPNLCIVDVYNLYSNRNAVQVVIPMPICVASVPGPSGLIHQSVCGSISCHKVMSAHLSFGRFKYYVIITLKFILM